MFEIENEWELNRYQHLADEIEYDDDDDGPRDAEMLAWLRGADSVSLEELRHRTGLGISIRCDSFHETVGEFDDLMFDVSGVQVNDYQAMSGELQTINEVTFLVPDDVSEFDTPDPQDEIVVRYDDGDTKVCDSLRLVGENLVRQISVVTDEIYLERIVLAYGFATDS